MGRKKGYRHSEETRQRISQRMQNNQNGVGNTGRSGRPHLPETIEQIRWRMMGNNNRRMGLKKKPIEAKPSFRWDEIAQKHFKRDFEKLTPWQKERIATWALQYHGQDPDRPFLSQHRLESIYKHETSQSSMHWFQLGQNEDPEDIW